MRILDNQNNELQSYDSSLGYTVEEQLFVAHHNAVKEVKEEFHYEYKTYPNGGRDRIKVIDIPAVAAKEPWDEYETILRYIEYTQEELDALEQEKNKPTTEQRIEVLEGAFAILKDQNEALSILGL